MKSDPHRAEMQRKENANSTLLRFGAVPLYCVCLGSDSKQFQCKMMSASANGIRWISARRRKECRCRIRSETTKKRDMNTTLLQLGDELGLGERFGLEIPRKEVCVQCRITVFSVRVMHRNGQSAEEKEPVRTIACMLLLLCQHIGVDHRFVLGTFPIRFADPQS